MVIYDLCVNIILQ